MKGNKGITLIALIVTIIVLIILAGVAIAMLTDDNGILKNASEARYDNIIASVTEQAGMATLSVKTTIIRNMNTIDGYIANNNNNDVMAGEDNTNFKLLVKEVKDSLNASDGLVTNDKLDGYYVGGAVVGTGGSATSDGEAFIKIGYTDNSLRSSLPSNAKDGNTKKDDENHTIFASGTTKLRVVTDGFSNNKAAIGYVIRVTSYSCELSKPILTTTAILETASLNSTALDGAWVGIAW